MHTGRTLADCVEDRHDQRRSWRRLSLQRGEREDECERAVDGQTCMRTGRPPLLIPSTSVLEDRCMRCSLLL